MAAMIFRLFRRLGVLGAVAALVWWVAFKKFPCPYCDGQGWTWEPRREMWYVRTCEHCQPEERWWPTDIPIGQEDGRVVGDRES